MHFTIYVGVKEWVQNLEEVAIEFRKGFIHK